MKKRLKFKKQYLFCALFIAFGLSVNNAENGSSKFSVAEKVLAEIITKQVTENIMPVTRLGKSTGENTKDSGDFFLKEFPIMVQAMPAAGDEIKTKEVKTEPDSTEDILAGMLAENGNREKLEQPVKQDTSQENKYEPPEELQEGMEDVLNESASGFQKHEKTNSFDFDALSQYQTLVSTFYTIDAGTTAGSNQLNLDNLMNRDMTVSKEDPGPQILIYHTHSLEGFIDSAPGDRSQTIVGVGDRLTQILTEEYGYSVLHHTEEYDTARDDAYANSLPGITKVLEENPSIQVVIDLHRDAGVDGVHRAIDLDGKSTATFMLFNGLSRTRKTGDIDYLYNPYLDDNLAFSFQMQLKAGEYYPGLTRKIYLKAYRYNMHLRPKSLLIELGDSNNTVEEAMNTCDPLAHVLDMVLSGEG